MNTITLLSKTPKYGHIEYAFDVPEGTTAAQVFKHMEERSMDNFVFGASLEWRSPTRAVVSVNTD